MPPREPDTSTVTVVGIDPAAGNDATVFVLARSVEGTVTVTQALKQSELRELLNAREPLQPAAGQSGPKGRRARSAWWLRSR